MVSSLPDRRFPARVKEFTTAADPVTRTFRITLWFEKPDGLRILPGMTAKVILTLRSRAMGQPVPAVGDTIILVDFGGHPRLIVRLTHIQEVPFGKISATHTAVDGSPVRDLKIWKPLHTRYWNGMLEEYGSRVSEEMPVWVEKFELLYDLDPP